MRTLFLDITPFEIRAALREGKRFSTLISFDPLNMPLLVGETYQGRVVTVDKISGGAFIEIGATQVFLPHKKSEIVNQGEVVAVTVTRRAMRTKHAVVKLSKAEALPIETAVVRVVQNILRERGVDQICVASVPQREALDQYLKTASLSEFRDKLKISTLDKQDFDIEEVFECALARQITLADKASYVFDETEALTAVDFNVGAAIGQSKTGVIIKSVLGSLPALVEQLGLRNIGGQIIVDFPREASSTKPEILERLKPLLPKGGKAGPMLASGLLHLTLPKTGPSLLEQVTQEIPGQMRAGREFKPYIQLAQAYRAVIHQLEADRSATFYLSLSASLWQHAQSDTTWFSQTNHRYAGRLNLEEVTETISGAWTIRKV